MPSTLLYFILYYIISIIHLLFMGETWSPELQRVFASSTSQPEQLRLSRKEALLDQLGREEVRTSASEEHPQPLWMGLKVLQQQNADSCL